MVPVGVKEMKNRQSVEATIESCRAEPVSEIPGTGGSSASSTIGIAAADGIVATERGFTSGSKSSSGVSWNWKAGG
jgi:hypothetical protein